MRKTLGRLILVSALLTFFTPAPAQAAIVDYNCGTSGTYQVDTATNTITRSTSCRGTLNIQAGVEQIASWAFQNNSDLTTITFPSSLAIIGQGAFSGSTFTEINFSEGLQTIGISAFSSTNAQIPLVLPDSVVTIRDRVFEQARFTSISFGPNISSFGQIVAYNNFGAGPSQVEFRGGSPLITNIGATSFVGFKGTEITLPVNLTTIAARAFDGATSLRYLIVPNSVTSIAQQALYPTSALHTVVLPDGLTTLGTSVFDTGLQTVVYCGSTSAVQSYAYPNSVVPTCGKAAIFERNGGAGSMATQVRNTSGALTSNTFTRSGYVFTGWNTKADGTGTSYGNGATYNFANHAVLYAQWMVPDLTAPSFLTTTSQSKAENQTEVAGILLNESATVIITGGSDQSKFTVSRVADSATALAFVDSPDYESPTDSDTNNTYIVVLRAIDGSSNISFETYTITITNSSEQILVIASTISRTVQKGVSNNLSLTFNEAVKATFIYNGKRIPGCISKPTATSAPFTVTCAFKPSVQGGGALSVRYSEISGINYGGTTSLGSVGVIKRSNKR